MNEPTITPDDPLLTAYALGELEGDEHATIEAAVQHDPALQAAVAEIRALAGELTEVLAGESTEQATSVLAVAIPAQPAPWTRPAKVVRFPYFLISGLAAACFAVMVVLYDGESPVRAKFETAEPAPTTMMEMMLPPLDEAVSADAIMPLEMPVIAAPTTVTPLLDQPRMSPPARGAAPPVVTFSVPPLVTPPLTLSGPSRADIAGVGSGGVRLGSTAPVQASGAANSLSSTQLATNAGDLSASITVVNQEQSQDMRRLGAAAVPADSGTVMLSPFIVETNASAGYLAGSTTVGTRLPSGLLPMPSPEPIGLRRGFVPPVVHNTEDYAHIRDNAFVRVGDHPLSTFAVDVDTASYANMRRFLQNGQRPPPDAVRIEELINYFPYRYPPPAPDGAVPFTAGIEAAAAPWNPENRLVRIGIKARELNNATRPGANLVFLIDVSGSMNGPNRLPLVKESLRLLLGRLKNDDRVAIVTYAGQSGLALPSTPVVRKREILAALDALRPSGSTNAGTAIHLAYDIARANFVDGGLNRVILCTDGDFNVGITNQSELVRLVEEKAESGVFLTVLGFGMGNLKDTTLESLANRGNGVYGYIDTVREARKLLVEQVDGSLATIAKDVKIQVEFNPAQVASYRLIGYENRLLNREDFDNDAIDAGEIGAGHTVTALYEIVPVGASPVVPAEPLRYQDQSVRLAGANTPLARELLTVAIRYKAPDGEVSERLDFPFTDSGAAFAGASGDFQFAAAVAGFGMILRDSEHKGQASYEQVINWAGAGLADDAEGHRGEFVELVRLARNISGG